MSKKTTRHNQIDLLLTAALFGIFVVAYLPVWKNLIWSWYQMEEYSHGFLVIPVCIYLLWLERDALSETPKAPSSWGLLLVFFSLVIYIFSHFAGVLTFANLSMILLLSGMVVYFYGFLPLKKLLFPLLLLLFMIPFPSQIYSKLTIPIQLLVSKWSVSSALSLGVPVYREGNVIHLPDAALQVVQACSGLRSMMSLLFLGALLAYFGLKSNLARSVLLLASIPVAVFVNIVRVFILILCSAYTPYDLTQGGLHTTFGIAIFLLALALLILIEGVLSLWDKKPARRLSSSSSVSV
jgi:exosortase